MLRKARYFLIIIALAAPLYVQALPYVQNDFDADGVSDLTSTSASGTALKWSSQSSLSSTEQLDKLFGLSTDTVCTGRWESPGYLNLCVVRAHTDSSALTWKIFKQDELVAEDELGRKGDTVLSGADFNGDGLTDAAAVRPSSKKGLVWRIRTDMFALAPQKERVLRFGKYGDRVLFLSPDGQTDWLAVFGKGKRRKAQLSMRSLSTRKVTRVNGFPLSLAKGLRPRPFPLQQADGSDLLLFVTSDETDTTLQLFDLTGDLLNKVTFPGLGNVVAGEFNAAEEGEEVAFQSGTTLTVYNPVTQSRSTQTVASSTVSDEINVAAISQ